MSLSHLKLGLLGAVTAISLLGGAGLANAATSPGASIGSAATPRHHAQPDAGVPSDGVHPDALVTAPDGTRISSTASNLAGLTRHPAAGSRTATTAATPASATGADYVQILVNGARQRAWVPNGTVVALGYTWQAAFVACKIPGSDGYIWGWTGVQHDSGWWSYGWMRGDLWRPFTPQDFPWC